MLRVATMGHQLAAATAHLVVEIPANGRLAPWLHTFFYRHPKAKHDMFLDPQLINKVWYW